MMIRQQINKELKQFINNEVAILFSGGVDSQTLLYSCLDLNIEPVLYTFYINDIKGSSYKFIRDIVIENKKIFMAPYKENDEISDYLLNRKYKDIHSPKQKQIVLNEYPEILNEGFYRRNSNLQCNSKLRECHSELLEVDDKSIIKEYNKIIKN